MCAEFNENINENIFAEFEASSKRSLETRLKYSFVKTFKPVMDESRFRSFNTLAEYKAWCEKCLPKWLGYSQNE